MMKTSRSRRRMVLAASTTAIAVLPFLGSTATAHPAHPVRITPVLHGLAAPRGIAFDGQGSMYVAESGVAGTGSAGLTHTGKVDKFRWGHTTPAWSTPFSSLFVTESPGSPPDVLGPEGLSSLSNRCVDRRHGRDACRVTMIMSESTLGVAAATKGAVHAPQAGHLFRLNGATGRPHDVTDVGTQMYQWTASHKRLFPSDFPDSNPYAVLVTRDHGVTRTFVADAGANTVSEVMRSGLLRIIAYIPNETSAPFRDATPTCIAQGPDGDLYVGTLHLAANFGSNGDKSDVWRMNPNANYPTRPHLWTSGLTTVSACTFDRAGHFWATEMFQGGPKAKVPGDVVEIPFSHPSLHRRIGFGQLLLPGGIAQGPDGAMYVTVGSAAPGVSGGVMRIAR